MRNCFKQGYELSCFCPCFRVTLILTHLSLSFLVMGEVNVWVLRSTLLHLPPRQSTFNLNETLNYTPLSQKPVAMTETMIQAPAPTLIFPHTTHCKYFLIIKLKVINECTIIIKKLKSSVGRYEQNVF